MSGKYQVELDNFTKRFASFKNLRIVLYGIGRYTVTLLEGLKGFNIVGLMDKDPDNMGKIVRNVPVISKDTAERTADLVIINTAETYWDVIYRRIKDIKIPVYYLNGERAKLNERRVKNPFKELSYSEMVSKIEKAEIISFDFFDTLFLRAVCNPQDVFRLMEKEVGIPIKQMRDRAKCRIKENYSLDELYGQIEILENIPHEQVQVIKQAEINIEKKLLVSRTIIVSLLRKLLNSGKEIYIISDMYLPRDFYLDVFAKYGICVSASVILLSNELDVSKQDGSLWKYYTKNIVKGRRALHIGDNVKGDVEMPMEYGVQAYLTPNVWELFLNSPLKDIAPYIYSIYDTCIMGCVLDKFFENPFVLNNSDASLKIRSNHDMGYCVFAPVIMTFLLWIYNKAKEDNIEKIVFMARDGYFLEEDFRYICELTGKKIECCYIGISRQLAMLASIETQKDLMEYVQMPYTGNLSEMFEDRFGIHCAYEDVGLTQEEYVNKYLPEIEKQIVHTRKSYLSYLGKFELNNNCALVDIGYYGNNQRYLNKLLGVEMIGYYINANLSDKNRNAEIQKMSACFQSNSDVTGVNSQVLRKQIYLESFLTAPYGMVKTVDAVGNFVCAPSKKNQEYFNGKKEINEGVKQFIADYINKFWDYEEKPESEFVDKYYGACFGHGLEFDDEVKKSFYNDNAMMNRLESSLFY